MDILPITNKPKDGKFIKGKGRVAMYKLGTNNYEVVVFKHKQAENIMGKDYPERMVYPSNEDWGTYGFSYIHRANADVKYEELLAE